MRGPRKKILAGAFPLHAPTGEVLPDFNFKASKHGSRLSNPSVKPGQKNPIDSNTIRSSFGTTHLVWRMLIPALKITTVFPQCPTATTPIPHRGCGADWLGGAICFGKLVPQASPHPIRREQRPAI